MPTPAVKRNELIAGIEALLRKITFAVPAAGADLFATGVLDSVSLVQLIASLERQYGIELLIDDVGLEAFRSIETIAATVEQLRMPNPAEPSRAPHAVPQAEVETTASLLSEIQELILEQFAVRIECFDEDLFDSGALDSMVLVQLILRLEERFGLDLMSQDLDLAYFSSIHRIAAFVEECFAKVQSMTA